MAIVLLILSIITSSGKLLEVLIYTIMACRSAVKVITTCIRRPSSTDPEARGRVCVNLQLALLIWSQQNTQIRAMAGQSRHV
jgi:hypothetical protein